MRRTGKRARGKRVRFAGDGDLQSVRPISSYRFGPSAECPANPLPDDGREQPLDRRDGKSVAPYCRSDGRAPLYEYLTVSGYPCCSSNPAMEGINLGDFSGEELRRLTQEVSRRPEAPMEELEEDMW